VGNDLSHNSYPGVDGPSSAGGNLVFLGANIYAGFAGDAGAGTYNRLVDDSIEGMSAYAVKNATGHAVDMTLVCWGTQGPTVDNYLGSTTWTSPEADCALLGVREGSPGPSLELRVRPNPARAGSVVSFFLSEPGPVDLRVYDIRGREVARLAEGPVPAGIQEFPWDGRDRAGRAVAAGIYLIRLRTPEQVSTQRVVRLAP
jgi:hypothetical protein